MTQPSAAVELHALCRAVVQSRGAIAEGNQIDLTGLEAEVSRVAEAAKSAPATERAAVLEAMEALCHELDGLTAALQRQRDASLAGRAAEIYGAKQGAR